MNRQHLNGRILWFLIVPVLLTASCNSRSDEDSRNNDRTWSVYKADEGSSSHSPLDQITVSNVSQLKPAWTFAINDLPPSAQPANSQSNPIIIDGVLYSLSAKRVAYAVNAATGAQIWTYDPFGGGGGGGVERGVTYWENKDDL